MKIDIDYIKKILDTALNHDQPYFDINHDEIRPLWESDELLNKLVFHLEIMKDLNLIESTSDDNNLGFFRSLADTFITRAIPLRLTATGHQFAADLSKPGVLQKLKSSFKDAGPAETIKIAFSLGKKVLEKKLEEFMD